MYYNDSLFWLMLVILLIIISILFKMVLVMMIMARILIGNVDMRRSTQEWTKENLWKTAFKKFEGVSVF